MRGVLAVSSGESSSQVGRKENATVRGGVLSPCMYREQQNIHNAYARTSFSFLRARGQGLLVRERESSNQLTGRGERGGGGGGGEREGGRKMAGREGGQSKRESKRDRERVGGAR